MMCGREDLNCKQRMFANGLCRQHHYYFAKKTRQDEEKKNGKSKQSFINR